MGRHSSLKPLNCSRKAGQTSTRYSWIFNVQLHSHLKKWTLKFKLLCLLVVSIWFAVYVAYIFTRKVWKFGWNPYYRCWNTKVFLEDLFFIGAHCTFNSLDPMYSSKTFPNLMKIYEQFLTNSINRQNEFTDMYKNSKHSITFMCC